MPHFTVRSHPRLPRPRPYLGQATPLSAQPCPCLGPGHALVRLAPPLPGPRPRPRPPGLRPGPFSKASLPALSHQMHPLLGRAGSTPCGSVHRSRAGAPAPSRHCWRPPASPPHPPAAVLPRTCSLHCPASRFIASAQLLCAPASGLSPCPRPWMRGPPGAEGRCGGSLGPAGTWRVCYKCLKLPTGVPPRPPTHCHPAPRRQPVSLPAAVAARDPASVLGAGWTWSLGMGLGLV